MDPTTWQWVIALHEETRRPINVFVLADSTRAAAYHHRSGRWALDPAMVDRVSWEDETEGRDRLRRTDRAGAERAATEFGTTLPTDDELSTMLTSTTPEEAVAAVLRWTGTDDQATEGRWRADPFREGWLVIRPTKRRGAPLFLVRGGLVRPVNLAHETLEEAWERMPEA